MTTNNHPANGPVSLDRLHQIREILSKAAVQSDGGNLGHAMADAVKVKKELVIFAGVVSMLHLDRSMLSHQSISAVNYNFVSPGAAGLYGENNVPNDPLT
ncbi:hypothetical protein [Citrobacter cronae]|uniref:Uncharacterized protein n=1 Tax=Citrobacter cronae TaxID=1748967 RepID=A0A7X1EG70_9ENTR|nr:hypothetical protein [Citrobacter cronae]MBC2618991.1 hypothetical protein [Citrobacter cronae]